MDTFLETYNLPILNKEEIENLNRSIPSNEKKKIESVIKRWSKNKCSGQDNFIGEFYKHLNKW